MKTYFLAVTILALGGTLTGQAQEMNRFRIGAHGAYSAGGDIEESKAGYGVQTEFAMTRNIGVELAASHFSDDFSEDWMSLEQDLTTIGLSVVGRVTLVQRLQGFLLAGVDYNLTEIDADVDPAAFEGLPVAVDVDVDDSVGFHLGAGLNVPVLENLELFAEYRYTFLELEGEVTASGMGVTLSEEIEEGDYNFGLVKLGLNYLF